MRAITQWLSDEPKTLRSFLWLCCYMFLLDLIWQGFAGAAVAHFFGSSEHVSRNLDTSSFSTYVHVVWQAIKEEFLWRLLPIACTRLLWPKHTWIMVVAIVAASIGFANIHAGARSIPLQGVGGLVHAAIFLKCSGMRERDIVGLLAGYLGAVFYHTAFDMFFLLGVLALGGGVIRSAW